jgi:4-hydroxy-tetrahydrodipicolinate synthase
METKFKGIGVALVTPFQENGTVDFAGLQRLVQHNISNGIDYLVVQGTTGESATLTSEEKRAVLDFIIEINAGRLPIVIGISGSNTAEVTAHIEHFDFEGVDAILSASPAYNKPSQEGIYQHYKALDAVATRPIILYNVPGRTASNMTAATTVRIAEDCPNVIAIKEASGDLDQIGEIIHTKPEGFLVISGDDGLTLPMVALGADGVISVVGNAFPKTFSGSVRAALQGDFATARKGHYELMEIITQLFADGNPGGVKEVLKFLSICGNHVRLPLVPVNEATSKKLYSLIAERDLVEAAL